jgi:hypothetical protein
MAQTETAAKTETAGKKEGRSFNLKTKVGEKWKTLGTLFLRADDSGGVATLFKDDGTKLENVSIFPNDGKYAGAKKS